MRSNSLPRPLLLAALACLALSGCGARRALDDHAAAATPPAVSDPELRYLELTDRVLRACAPHDPHDGARGVPPRPEDLPGWEGGSPPAYGPGETPPGVPGADGDIPVPLPPDATAPPESDPSPVPPPSLQEVPLNGIEKCVGDEHARRVREAFRDTGTTSWRTMREKLTALDYPTRVIHRMPDRAGAPRARVDLRFMAGHAVLEVTGTGAGVRVEPFGAPETEDVKVTDVRRTPPPDRPGAR
ncbi:hypothetical protein [Streptomyces thermolilacinus]|uniref:hypothetical protein n=1 Tax=Streptomyces thermolilacinus TaxID=285540 RepID=UPI0033ED5FB0